MIVPHAKLLWAVALWALPLALLGALIGPLTAPALALIALLVALALLDAVLAHGRLRVLRVRPVGVTRLTEGRAGELELEFENTGGKALAFRLGLDLPEELESESEATAFALLEGAALSRGCWPLQARRRGRYVLARAHVERRSPLGFWLVRAGLELGAEVRVYPDLLPERRGLAALFLPRGTLGIRHRRQVGKGRDFEKLREYIPGDALADIHWKTTAKRGRPITKLYQIERTQEVYVIVDASRLSGRLSPAAKTKNGAAAPETTVLDRFLSATLVTCLAAERQGDLFGLITFSDKVHSFLPARNGRSHYNTCRDEIYTLQPRLVTPDYDELFTTIRLRLRRRALLVFLTSLDDPTLAEAFQRRLDLACRHHLILVNMLAPPESRELFDAPDVASETEIIRRLGGHMLWNDLRLLERSLASRGVRFSALASEGMVTELVSQYLEIKQRQML